MLHWRLTLKDLVASYQRVGLEFNELKDRDVVSKLLSLLYEHCANQVTNQMLAFVSAGVVPRTDSRACPGGLEALPLC